MSRSNPCRSSANDLPDPRKTAPHSLVLPQSARHEARRAASASRFAMFAQSCRWTITPRVRVMNPDDRDRAAPACSTSRRAWRCCSRRARARRTTPSTARVPRAARSGATVARLAAHRDLDLACGHLAAAERGEEVVELRDAQAPRRCCSCDSPRLPRRCSSLSSAARPSASVLLEVLVAEPLAHLGGRARAGEIAALRREPVARRRRPASPHMISTRCAFGELVVERHHLRRRPCAPRQRWPRSVCT